MTRHHLLLIALACAAPGCAKPLVGREPAVVVSVRTADTAMRPKSDPDTVQVHVAGRAAGGFDVLGVVAVTAYRGDDPLYLLRLAAANLGATDVDEVRVEATPSATSFSAVALARRDTSDAARAEPAGDEPPAK